MGNDDVIAVKEAVLDALFSRLRGDLSRQSLAAGYDRAALDSNCDSTLDPRTAWGMAMGLTSSSQDSPYADERAKIDRAAGRVLQLAF